MKPLLGRHRIGAVARLTGISEHALRVWERRYGTVAPLRLEGGQRLYSDADVSRLRRLKHLTDLGHAIGGIARLTDSEIEALVSSHPEPKTSVSLRPVGENGSKSALVEAIRERFLGAIAALDMETAERVITRALVAFDPLELITDVMVPLLEEIGDRWEHSQLSIAQEHAATAVLRSHLGSVIRIMPPQPGAPLAICATPSGEQHEFGALFAAIVCAARGWRVVYLGAALPVDEIAQAAQQTGASAVMLSIVALKDVEIARDVSRLRVLLPRSVELYLGGRGVDPKIKLVGVRHLEDLRALAQVLDDARPR